MLFRSAGLAVTSKYSGAFLGVGGVLLLLADAPMRRQLRRPGPWLAVVVAALVLTVGSVAMAVVDPQSTTFQRSEMNRLVRDQGRILWSQEWEPGDRISDNLRRAVIDALRARGIPFSANEFALWSARERVRDMLRALGPHEVQGIVVERGEVEVGCEFCGQRYRFDAVDVGGLFTPQRDLSAAPGSLQDRKSVV